jgi:hypothetical protein
MRKSDRKLQKIIFEHTKLSQPLKFNQKQQRMQPLPFWHYFKSCLTTFAAFTAAVNKHGQSVGILHISR